MFNLNFLIILLIGFVDYLGIGLVYPIFAIMLFDAGDPILAAHASPAYRGTILGILMGLTPLSAFVFAPFLGSFSDCRGRKKTLIFGLVAGCIGYGLAILGMLFHSLLLLLAFRILIGITEGTVAVAQAAIADISDESNKARRFSLFGSSLGFGFTIGPFIGGMLADPEMNLGLGYVPPFFLAGLLCLINLLCVLCLFPESRNAKGKLSFSLSESMTKIAKAFTWKHLTWLLGTGFCLSFSWAFFNEFMPVLLQNNFGFALREVANYFAWGGVWYSLSSAILTAPLLSRYSQEKLILFSMGGCALCMSIFSMIKEAEHIWIALPFLMYFLSMAFPILASIVSNRAHGDNQGEVLGVYHSIQGLAMGLSPMFVGSVIGAFPALTGWGSAAVMLLAILTFLIGRHIPSTFAVSEKVIS
jgi:DHA1 family tetracycline resistance protein-like MFS transporter